MAPSDESEKEIVSDIDEMIELAVGARSTTNQMVKHMWSATSGEESRSREFDKEISDSLNEAGKDKVNIQDFGAYINAEKSDMLYELYTGAMESGVNFDSLYTGDAIEKPKSRKGRETKCRKVFENNSKELFAYLNESYPEYKDFFDSMEQEWGEKGVWHFFSSSTHSRSHSLRNAYGHRYEYNTKLFLFEAGDEHSGIQLIQSLAEAFIDSRILRAILEGIKLDSTKLRSEINEKLFNAMYYEGADTRAEDRLNKAKSMPWGPEDFVMEESQLDQWFQRLEKHPILILRGLGQVGKTALAAKMWYEFQNGRKCEDVFGTFEFDHHATVTTKINSKQGDWITDAEEGRVKIIDADHRTNLFDAVRGDDGRLSGASTRIWRTVVRQFETIDYGWGEIELRDRALKYVKQRRILVIIDNFEDLQDPNEEDEKEQRNAEEEYGKIVGWLSAIWNDGSTVKGRVIITTRATEEALGGRTPVPGFPKVVQRLDAPWAVKLFQNKVSHGFRLGLYPEKTNEVIRQTVGPESEQLLFENFKLWGRGGAHPMIVIAAAVSLGKFETLEECLKSWGEGNEDARSIYKYITEKMWGNLSQDEKNFLEKLIALEMECFDIGEMDLMGVDFEGEETNNRRKMFLSSLESMGFMYSVDDRGEKRFCWHKEVLVALRSHAGIKPEARGKIEDEIVERPVKSQSSKKGSGLIDLTSRWEKWLQSQRNSEGEDDFSKVVEKDGEENPYWKEKGKRNDILQMVTKESVLEKARDEEELQHFALLCTETLTRMATFQAQRGRIGIWSRGVAKRKSGGAIDPVEVSKLAKKEVEVTRAVVDGLVRLTMACLDKLLRSGEGNLVDAVLSKGPSIVSNALANWKIILDDEYGHVSRDDEGDYGFLEAGARLWILQIAIRGGSSSEEVSDMLEQSAECIDATANLEAKFDSLGFEVYGKRKDEVIDHYKTWHTIYSSGDIRINEQELEQIRRLRRHAFWISIALFRHFDGRVQKYKQWQTQSYADSARAEPPAGIAVAAIDGVFIRQAESIRLNNSSSWQRSFDQVCRLEELRKGVRKGDYIVCKMQLDPERRGTIVQKDEQTGTEVRCRLPEDFRPGYCIVKVLELNGSRVIIGEGIPAEEETATKREIEKSVYNGLEAFVKWLVELLEEKDGEGGYILKRTIEKYLEGHWSEFWDDPDYSSKILWINGIEYHEDFRHKGVFDAIIEYSNNSLERVPYIEKSAVAISLTKEGVRNATRRERPKYTEIENSEFMWMKPKHLRKKLRGITRSLILPKNPYLTARILRGFHQLAIQEDLRQEVEGQSYRDIMDKFVFWLNSEIAERGCNGREITSQIAARIALGERRKKAGGFRTRPTEPVDWELFPSDLDEFINELRDDTLEFVPYNARTKREKYPENYEEIIRAYYEEVLEHAKDLSPA